MKRNIIKAEEELVYVLKETIELKHELNDARQNGSKKEVEFALKELRTNRIKYAGMVSILSIITEEDYNDISYRIKEKVEK